MRAREEERDDLFIREEHRERMRRDGSSCSSYYSVSSTGEYNSDDEIEDSGEVGVELSNVYEKDLERSERIISEEVEKEEYRGGLRKKSTEIGIRAGSSGVESDFRKKSEKKLY
ncbi:Hypothetical predicted protein [Olea europaea subsp. europaea]|uniref:Uncharacterized protein n=1 Tax=Olea europaea subsp. europaea TaxID=158383 RepID=A0A8S0RH05_OLEEU|nr:Hypothetical predicted protein [Olea europaea subsp. europaea]